MVLKLYLTIDDSPSPYTYKKVDFLKQHDIPTLFYCRGEFIAQHPDQVIYAIQKGFRIGNHSYTHPYFSKIPLSDCFDEILKTQELISQCYTKARITEPSKIIRLPFGDRGAGTKAQKPTTLEDTQKVDKIQKFLHDHDYHRVAFEEVEKNLINDQSPLSPKFVDSYWTLDSQDYKQRFIANKDLYLESFIQLIEGAEGAHILLLHDFENNHALFEDAMGFLLTQDVQFLQPKIDTNE